MLASKHAILFAVYADGPHSASANVVAVRLERVVSLNSLALHLVAVFLRGCKQDLQAKLVPPILLHGVFDDGFCGRQRASVSIHPCFWIFGHAYVHHIVHGVGDLVEMRHVSHKTTKSPRNSPSK